MRKRGISLLFIVIFVLSLVSCGVSSSDMDDYVTNKDYSNKSQTENVQLTETKAGTKVIKKENLKIGVLYIGSAQETSGYTYAHELGISQMINNIGLQNNQVIRKENINDGDQNAIDKALDECISDGCNVIIGTSWGYMDEMNTYSEKYPDIYFSHGTGYKSNGKNFTNYFGRIYQARYLSGIVAGLKTKTNKIGYVAAQGTDNSEVTGGIDAFALGVESVNKDAKIYVKVTHSWYDPEGEDKASVELLNKGCDCLAQHCDTTAPQVEAEKHGVWAIGYNSDMSKETPKATLTSVLWSWSAYYTSYIQSIIEGSYDGSNYFEGMNVGLVGLADLSDLNDSKAEDLVNKAKEKIVDGSFNVFDGELKTNTGKIIGENGKTLDDKTITGGIDWYYQNVELID